MIDELFCFLSWIVNRDRQEEEEKKKNLIWYIEKEVMKSELKKLLRK